MIGKGESRHLGFSPFTAGPEEWATLEVASFPSVDFEGIFKFIKDYEHNCGEQLASRGITLLSIKDMLPDEKKRQAEKLIPEILQQLYQRQLGSGGFAYWPGSPDADSWVSSMAGQFMVMASQDGFSVSKGVIASWARYQKKAVQDYRANPEYPLWDFEQAYRLYTLALKGEAESGAMNRLKDSENLSQQAGWMLAAAYAVAGKKNIAKDMVAGLRTDFPEYTESGRTFGSPTRDKAVALETCVLIDDVPSAMDIAQEVSKAMSGGWYMSLETAFASRGMASLAGKVNTGNIEVEVSQSGNVTPLKGPKSVYSLALDTRSGGADVKNNSDGVVYATLITSSVPGSGVKNESRGNGISMNVTYTSSSGKVLNPAEIAQGTDFTVTITVGNSSPMRDYTYLALTEVVPSGWEIFNDRLFSPGETNGGYSNRDIRDDRVIWYFNLPRGRSKTFKVNMRAAYEGEFTLPSVKCEALYDAHVSANSASGTTKVTSE